MAEGGYQFHRRLGITGPHTASCWAAGIDRGFDEDVQTDGYDEYIGLMESKLSPGRAFNKRLEHVLEVVADGINLDSRHAFEFAQVKNFRSFETAVNKFVLGGLHVVVDLKHPTPKHSCFNTCHSTGLLPVGGDHYLLRSTWQPPQLRGPQTLEKIWNFVDVPEMRLSKTYPFLHANITGVPKP